MVQSNTYPGTMFLADSDKPRELAAGFFVFLAEVAGVNSDFLDERRYGDGRFRREMYVRNYRSINSFSTKPVMNLPHVRHIVKARAGNAYQTGAGFIHSPALLYSFLNIVCMGIAHCLYCNRGAASYTDISYACCQCFHFLIV